MGRTGLLGNGWKRLVGIGGMLLLIVGCSVPPPLLRPPRGPDELNKPPMAARYSSKEFPAIALEGYDSQHRSPTMGSSAANAMSNGIPMNQQNIGSPGSSQQPLGVR